MQLTTPNCPKCGQPARGTLETLHPVIDEQDAAADAVADLVAAARATLDDLERHARTHGPGPDARLAVLRDALNPYTEHTTT